MTQARGDGVRKSVERGADQAREMAQRTRRESLDLLEHTGYAVLGGLDAVAETLREVTGQVLDAAYSAPARGREHIDELSARGRRVAKRIGRGPGASRVASEARRGRRRASAALERARQAVSGSRSAGAPPYEERTLDELYELATERGIEGRSQMRKDELIEALRS